MRDVPDPDVRCAGMTPELFFPERGGSIKRARAYCVECEIKGTCFQDAVDRGERHGVWGGHSQTELREQVVHANAIRHWAQKQGMDCAETGPISPDVIAAYNAAHEPNS